MPLSAQAKQALAAHRHTRGERVFCDEHGKPFTQGVMASQLERMCRLAGLRTIGWHVLRHTFASALVMRGVHIKAVQELMGHSSLTITMCYAHLAPHVSQDAVRLLDGPSERTAQGSTSGPMPVNQPAPEPTHDSPAEKSRRSRAQHPEDGGTAAKNWQKTPSEPLVN